MSTAPSSKLVGKLWWPTQANLLTSNTKNAYPKKLWLKPISAPWRSKTYLLNITSTKQVHSLHGLETLQILLNLCAVCRGSRSMRSMSTRLDAKEYDIRPRRKSGLTVRMMSNTLILWEEPIIYQTGYKVSGRQTQGRVRCCTCGRKVTASNSGHNAYRFGFDLELCSWRMIYCLTHKRRSTVSVLSGTSSDAACKLDGNDPNVSAQPRRGDWPKRVKRVMVSLGMSGVTIQKWS